MRERRIIQLSGHTNTQRPQCLWTQRSLLLSAAPEGLFGGRCLFFKKFPDSLITFSRKNISSGQEHLKITPKWVSLVIFIGLYCISQKFINSKIKGLLSNICKHQSPTLLHSDNITYPACWEDPKKWGIQMNLGNCKILIIFKELFL